MLARRGSISIIDYATNKIIPELLRILSFPPTDAYETVRISAIFISFISQLGPNSYMLTMPTYTQYRSTDYRSSKMGVLGRHTFRC